MSLIELTDPALILMEHSNYEMEFPVLNKLEHTSILTGKKHFINLGYSAKFTITVNLFKYADPITTYNTLKSFEGHNIVFGLGENNIGTFTDVFGNDADFYVNEVTPYYLTKTEFYDQVKIVLTSINYLNINEIFDGYGLKYGLNYGK